jgi:hypothetical protein
MFKYHRKQLSIGLLAFILVTILFVLGGCSGKNSPLSWVTPSSSDKGELPNGEVVSTLTGVEVDASLLDRKPLAVMIENSPQARPQSGLVKADIVYEMNAEGGITRFMAIYYSGDAKVAGPVRSARPYYVDRLLEYDAIYAHAGGSGDGIKYIKKHDVADLEGLALNKPYFWRDYSRNAPHNMYANTLELRKKAEQKGYFKTGDVPANNFLEDGEVASNGAPTDKIKIGYRVSTVTWKYDTSEKAYLRFYGARAHRDREIQKQIAAKNIIVQYAKTRVLDDWSHHLEIDFVGTGSGLLFQNGQVYPINWQKDSVKAPTKYSFADGSEVKFVPGQTWIEVVKKGETKVEYGLK